MKTAFRYRLGSALILFGILLLGLVQDSHAQHFSTSTGVIGPDYQQVNDPGSAIPIFCRVGGSQARSIDQVLSADHNSTPQNQPNAADRPLPSPPIQDPAVLAVSYQQPPLEQQPPADTITQTGAPASPSRRRIASNEPTPAVPPQSFATRQPTTQPTVAVTNYLGNSPRQGEPQPIPPQPRGSLTSNASSSSVLPNSVNRGAPQNGAGYSYVPRQPQPAPGYTQPPHSSGGSRHAPSHLGQVHAQATRSSVPRSVAQSSMGSPTMARQQTPFTNAVRGLTISGGCIKPPIC